MDSASQPRKTKADLGGCIALDPVAGPGTSVGQWGGPGSDPSDLRVVGPEADSPGLPGIKYRLMIAYFVNSTFDPQNCGQGECSWDISASAQILALQPDGSYKGIDCDNHAGGDAGYQRLQNAMYKEWHGVDCGGAQAPNWGVMTDPSGAGGSGTPGGGQPVWSTTVLAACKSGTECTSYTVQVTSNPNGGGAGLSASAAVLFCCECLEG